MSGLLVLLICYINLQALAKCEKRRTKAAEAWVRGAHAARQEQAAQRREEKRKQEKERILAVSFQIDSMEAALGFIFLENVHMYAYMVT